MSQKSFKNYQQVPWYRRSSVSSIFLFLGLIFPLFFLVVVILLATGDIYYNTTDPKGNLKTWSKANKVAAWVTITLWLLIILWIFFSVAS